MTVGGLVLAAGAGRRFGGVKQLAELDGVPLLQHALDAMLAVPAIDPIRVVLGASADRVRAAVDFGDAEALVCAEWEEGMAASLRCGTRALAGCAWIIVTLGDQPRITPQVIAAIVDRAESAPSSTTAVRATYGGEPGHPVALGAPLLPHVHELHGDVGARELLAHAVVRTFEVGHLCRPDDVDTPEHLEALRS